MAAQPPTRHVGTSATTERNHLRDSVASGAGTSFSSALTSACRAAICANERGTPKAATNLILGTTPPIPRANHAGVSGGLVRGVVFQTIPSSYVNPSEEPPKLWVVPLAPTGAPRVNNYQTPGNSGGLVPEPPVLKTKTIIRNPSRKLTITFTNPSPILHKSFTNPSQIFHKPFTKPSQIQRKSFANPWGWGPGPRPRVSGGSQRGSKLRGISPTNLSFPAHHADGTG